MFFTMATIRTLNLTYVYNSAKNKDNDTKLAGYDPWGLQDKSRILWMIHCGICDMTGDV